MKVESSLGSFWPCAWAPIVRTSTKTAGVREVRMVCSFVLASRRGRYFVFRKPPSSLYHLVSEEYRNKVVTGTALHGLPGDGTIHVQDELAEFAVAVLTQGVFLVLITHRARQVASLADRPSFDAVCVVIGFQGHDPHPLFTE